MYNIGERGMILQRVVLEFLEGLAIELVDKYDDKIIEWFQKRVADLKKEKDEKKVEEKKEGA